MSTVVFNGATDADFDALNPKNKRRVPSTQRPRPEDMLLTDSRRQRLSANSQDVFRNMALLSWAIRRTLDYCCLWDFQPRTGDDGLDAALRLLMARDCEPEQVDYFGRMSWDDHRRTAEAGKLLNGDAFFLRLNSGRLQQIEGCYCVSPGERKAGHKWVNGAKLSSGRPIAWNFREEDNDGRAVDTSLSAGWIWQHCQWEGRPNVIRPQSPLVAAINTFRDVDETFDHARAKVKLDQLFGLAMISPPDADEGFADDDDADEPAAGPRQLKLGDGPAVFDLDSGADVKPIQANNPGQNTQEFLKLCIQLAIKCLDLPFNFFDEAYTNFFGSRAAWNLYERACFARRETQRRLHHKMTVWRLWRWVLPVDFGGTGEIALPGSMRVEDVRFKWVPRGIPFWKPVEELDVALKSVAAGLKSFQDICDEQGLGDYRENVREILAEREEIGRLGLVQRWNQNNLPVYLADASAVAAAVVGGGGVK